MEALIEYAWLVPALPLVAAALIAAFGSLMPGKGSEIGIAAVAVSFLVSVGIAWHTWTNAPFEAVEEAVTWFPIGNGLEVELGMLVDGLTAMMFLLVTTVSFMVQIYSREYMKGETRFTYFYAMLSLFTFSMLFLVIANNTLQAVVGWELVGVCSYLLIGFYWEEKSNQDAGNKAFMTTKFADIGLIVGVIVLAAGVAGAGGGDAFNIRETIDLATAGELANGTIVLGCLMIFLGAVGKSGQMPLHVWLPDAMAGPTPVSALIHAATMVTAGVFLVARLYPVFAQSAGVMATIAIVGVVTLFFAGFLALVEDDIKKVLAYSTISQLGYMMAALGVGGYTAGIFHLFTHGFFKALLFLGSGSLIHAVHSNNMSDMGGLRTYMPHTFWTFIVGSLALAGFPLTAGFFSKDEILVSGELWAGQGFLTGNLVLYVGLAGAFVTTFYMARACFKIFWGGYRGADAPHGARVHHGPEDHEAHAEVHASTPHESGKQILVPLMVLAVLSLAAGWPGSPFWPDEEHHFGAWTATEALEHTTYPFLEGADDHAAAPTGEGLLASGTVVAAAEAEDGHGAGVLHGVPSFHPGLAAAAFAIFLLAVGLAWRFYAPGRSERDPTLHMGGLTTVLVNKYYLDDLGYRFVVVPVRDGLSRLAYWSNQEVLDRVVKGVGGVTKELANATYRTLDQKVIDGGVNGAAFSAAWWSDRLKRVQSGNVQRYAGALIAGVIVLLLVFAAAR